jgi:LPXTG-motif cell wall-anchored protein
VIPEVPYVEPDPIIISEDPTPGSGGGDYDVTPVSQLQQKMTITDQPVPLAKAPKTGDLSGIWAVISGLSLGGAALLNRKRKEEE